MNREKSLIEESRVTQYAKVDLAFEKLERTESISFERTTTEEHERRKKEIAEDISTGLIGNLSPEDRLEVFNIVRSRLEKALKSQVEEMSERLENEMAYFDAIQEIIY